MKKEIPILFSTDMVQAILDGRKTMTRLAIKPQPDQEGSVSFMANPPLDWQGEWYPWKWETSEGESISKHCPYGQPGDILWVRESWNMGTKKELAPDDQWMQRNDGIPKGEWVWVYRAGTVRNNHPEHPEWGKKLWKPSIHMPKSACRIWLEVTDVRAERLQDISEQDAIAEGVESWVEERMKSRPTHYKVYCDLDNPNDPATYSSTAKVSFETLWHKINGKESWEDNPWVWVVSFKVLSTTGRPDMNYAPSLIASPGEGAVIVEPAESTPK